MRREPAAVRQAAQVDDAPHPCLASRPREVHGGLALLGFELGTGLHGVGQVERGILDEEVEALHPDRILLSPGPCTPSEAGILVPLIRHMAGKAPIFGVCLGLQGMVEAFGGELGVLDYPMHGKPSLIHHRNQGVFEGLPETFRVGRYHSLFAKREKLPACLEITAETFDHDHPSEAGVIMGVRHRNLPMEAVQFHPESILTLDGGCGLKLIENMVRRCRGQLEGI